MTALLLALGEWTYVGWAYGIVVGVLVAFAVLTILRGRKLGRDLPPEDRRWL